MWPPRNPTGSKVPANRLKECSRKPMTTAEWKQKGQMPVFIRVPRGEDEECKTHHHCRRIMAKVVSP